MNQRRKTPKHCQHKPSGLGYIRLNGKCHYTGKWGSEEGERKYAELLAAWLAGGRSLPETGSQTDYSVRDLVADYLAHASGYYRKDGVQTREVVNIRYALKPLLRLYGWQRVAEFGPRCLSAYREDLIDQDLCRTLINQRVGIVKRVFNWAASEELIPGECAAALRSVAGLKHGRSRARETAPVKPVSKDDVDATIAHLGPQVGAMARLQWLTGMRPGEVVQMRWGEIDQSGKIWMYRPHSHKTEHHGRTRVIPLGPKAQVVLNRFRLLHKQAPIFSPRATGRPSASEAYTVVTYRQAVNRACHRARVLPWTPNQLRHSAATRIRREFGLDAARALLGHSTPVVTEIYAELDSAEAARVMGEVG